MSAPSDLEEPRGSGSSFALEAGMVFIVCPFLTAFPAVMRADRYLVTDTGTEQLTTYR